MLVDLTQTFESSPSYGVLPTIPPRRSAAPPSAERPAVKPPIDAEASSPPREANAPSASPAASAAPLALSI